MCSSPSSTGTLCSKSFTNDELKSRIRRIWSRFVVGVDPERMSDWLVEEFVIDPEQWQKIYTDNGTRQTRCRALLHHLHSIQHPRAFLVVYKALVEENHYLLDLIENQKPDTEKTEQQRNDFEDETRVWEEEKDRLLKIQNKHEDQKRAWEEEKDRFKKMQNEFENQKRAWKEEKDRFQKMQKEFETQKRAWKEQKGRFRKIKNEYEYQKRAWAEEKDRFRKMQNEFQDQKRIWKEEKDRFRKMQNEFQDQKRIWKEEKDRFQKMQNEHEDQKIAWTEEKVRFRKMQSEHEDQQSALKEENDRLLIKQKEHENQERAWNEEKDCLLKKQNEHKDQKRAWKEEKERLLKIKNEHEDQMRLWRGQKDCLLKMQNEHEDQKRSWKVENDRLQTMENEHIDQERAWNQEKDCLLKKQNEHEDQNRALQEDKDRLLKMLIHIGLKLTLDQNIWICGGATIDFSSIPEDKSEETLRMIFETELFGGEGETTNIIFQKGRGSKVDRPTLSDREVATPFDADQAAYDSAYVRTQVPSSPKYVVSGSFNTIKVSGFPKETSTERIAMYFENKKLSGGGKLRVLEHQRGKGKVVVKFDNPEDALNVSKKTHILSGTTLKISALEMPLENVESCAIEVKGVYEETQEQLVACHFEYDLRRFGYGMPTVFPNRDTGTAVFVFKDATAVKHVMKKLPLNLNGVSLEVNVLEAAPPPPLLLCDVDKKRLLSKRLPPAVTKEGLREYLKHAARAQMVGWTLAVNPSTAILDFNSEPDYLSIRRLVCSKPFLGKMISIRRIPLTSSMPFI